MAERRHEPGSAAQLARAIAALGLWNGDPAACDHAAEAERLGGALAYRAHLATWLLGAFQATLVDIEGGCLEHNDWVGAVGQELHSAVREEDDWALLGMLRWETLRVAYRLRELAGRDPSGLLSEVQVLRPGDPGYFAPG